MIFLYRTIISCSWIWRTLVEYAIQNTHHVFAFKTREKVRLATLYPSRDYFSQIHKMCSNTHRVKRIVFVWHSNATPQMWVQQHSLLSSLSRENRLFSTREHVGVPHPKPTSIWELREHFASDRTNRNRCVRLWEHVWDALPTQGTSVLLLHMNSLCAYEYSPPGGGDGDGDGNGNGDGDGDGDGDGCGDGYGDGDGDGDRMAMLTMRNVD